MRNLLRLAALVLATAASAAEPVRAPWSPTAPSTAPALFGEGVISTADYDLNASFTPDGRTVYFSKSTPNFASWTIVFSRFVDGLWTRPEVAPFSGRWSDADPFVAPDGSRLFFISDRPNGARPAGDYDIWMVERTPTGWGEPVNLGAPVNTDRREYYPSVTADGTLYFSSLRPGGKGSFDLYRARLVDGRYQEPENLGDAINTPASDVDAVIAPDESFLVFASFGRPDDLGRGDLYVSRRVADAWTPARNLGPRVNGPARDFCPTLSPDGRFLFFSSERGFADAPRAWAIGYDELERRLRAVDNGLGNIYLIDLAAALGESDGGLERVR